jgi:serine/threonine protein kinase
MLEDECSREVLDLEHELKIENTATTWFDRRNIHKRAIHEFLSKNLNINQWDMCMTGKKADDFKSHFKSIEEIGKGTFGQVYRVEIQTGYKPIFMVVKEAYLSNIEKRMILNNKKITGFTTQKWDKIPEAAYPFEFKYLKLLNQVLNTRECPNFLYTYNIAMCKGCSVNTLFRQYKPRTGYCYLTFMESAYSDLSRAILNKRQQISILYQLLIAVHTIHQKFALHHRDIKKHNIMIQYIDKGGYFEYIINNKSYFVENAGVVAFLADFGGSSSYFRRLQYDFEQHTYGTRLARLKRSRIKVENSFLTWEPLRLPGFITITWTDQGGKKVKGTINKITNKNVSTVEKLINIEDVRRYPCFEFYNDIQDVIRVFTGGKQATQPGMHSRLVNLDYMLERKLHNVGYMDKNSLSMFRIHGTVKYVLADEMLDQLYDADDIKDDIKIIDTFRINKNYLGF